MGSYASKRTDREYDRNKNTVMILPKLKKKYFTDALFQKKKQDCINHYLEKRGIDPTDTQARDEAIQKNNRELQQMLAKKDKNPNIVIPTELYELAPTDEMVLSFIYRNWMTKYRYSEKVDGKDVQSDINIPLFPRKETAVSNGVVTVDILPQEQDDIYSLAMNGLGSEYNWVTYLSDLTLVFLGNSSIFADGSVQFFYNPNVDDKTNAVNAMRSTPKDAEYSLMIPLGKTDGAKKAFKINLGDYKAKSLPTGTADRYDTLSDRLVIPGKIGIVANFENADGSMPGIQTENKVFSTEDEMWDYDSNTWFRFSDLKEYYGKTGAPNTVGLKRLVERRFIREYLRSIIKQTDESTDTRDKIKFLKII